ncbi:putative iron binding protein [Parageobacillus genomosp. 1]|jgi:Fe-S cluster assembly iron-binding protein IscA|uniref:Iron binding protein n=1 Tax=Parageobacillus genomosp. 1 TaxID=1295642 RepID=A0ABC9VE51_9BACL|nr:adhesin [Parageobacillus genomosp. 1]EZP76696.1 putative iron binding protein [Parageobacillus genomosp. 1]
MVITEKAKTFITKVMEENGVDTLRFTFEGAGCCGPQLGLSLDNPQITDRLEIINGIRVAMDEQVASIIEGVTLDAEETEEGVQFVLLGLNQCC